MGYFWDDLLNGHLRDYDRRAQGLFYGEYHMGELFAETAFVMRGTDNRRSFVINGKPYTEETAGGLSNGGEVDLGDEPITEDEEWNIFSKPEGADEGEGDEGASEAKADAVVAPAAAEKPAAKKPARKTPAKAKSKRPASKAKAKPRKK